MARVQLVMPDDDREQYADQARREGMSLSSWLRAAAHERLETCRKAKQFQSAEDIRAFFRMRSGLDGPETEPDWSEHLRALNESRARGWSET